MKYFRMDEFRCRCCGKIASEANTEALVENVLDPARERLGSAITVNSGTRCGKHNREVGGVPNSQHLRSEAADCYCKDNRRLARIIAELGKFDQMILYPTFIHVSYKRNGGNRKQILKKTASGYQRISINEI